MNNISALTRRALTLVCVCALLFAALSCERHATSPSDQTGQQPGPPPAIAWMQTASPAGGYINSVYTGPSGKVYAGTAGGLFISSNGGDSWNSAGSAVAGRDINCALETASGHIFAGGGGCTPPVAIMRSTDGGANWTACENGLTGLYKCVLCFTETSSGALLAGLGSGLFRSTDDGNSWSLVNGGSAMVNVLSLAVSPNGYLYAGAQRGAFYRSTDDGINWITLALDSSTGTFSIVHNSAGSLFIATGKGMMRSTDNGVTWTSLTVGLPVGSAYSATSSVSGGIFATGENWIARSVDNGQTWSQLSSAPTHNTSIVAGIGSTVLVGTYAGVYRSTDNGATWNTAYSGMNASSANGIACGSGGNIFCSVRSAYVFHSTDRGASWTPANAGLGISFTESLGINASGHLFAGTYGGDVYRSTNNGDAWTKVGTVGDGTQIQQIIFTPSGDVVCRSYLLGISRSTDNGSTWSSKNTGLPTGNGTCMSLAIGPNDILLTGVSNKSTQGVFRSTDKGGSWTRATPDSLGGGYISCLAVDTTGTVFAGGSSGVCRSTDNGSSWTRTAFPTNVAVVSLAINSQGHLFAGTSNGSAYRSVDGGLTWSEVGAGISGTYVQLMATDADGYLYAAVQDHGIFRTVGPTVSWK